MALLPLTAQRLEDLSHARRAAAARAAALASRAAEALPLLRAFAEVNRSVAEEWAALNAGVVSLEQRVG
jgi:hypothetical protein